MSGAETEPGHAAKLGLYAKFETAKFETVVDKPGCQAWPTRQAWDHCQQSWPPSSAAKKEEAWVPSLLANFTFSGHSAKLELQAPGNVNKPISNHQLGDPMKN